MGSNQQRKNKISYKILQEKKSILEKFE